MSDAGVVAIGRNEGERLRRCLRSVIREGATVVYVDSGSTDRSVELARGMGVEVVDLDLTRPFTAARARNAGFERLQVLRPDVRLVFFIDGDCEAAEGWLDRAVAELGARPDVAAVCGRLRERFPEASIYARLCQVEWDGPVGEVDACGGIFVVRIDAFKQAGGFDESIAAGEEPELCQRLTRLGFRIVRLADAMALHDAALRRFADWWRREVRCARGALDVYSRFGVACFAHQTRSARLWAVGWPIATATAAIAGSIAVGPTAGLLGAAVVATAWPLQAARIAWRGRRRCGLCWPTAIAYGVLTMTAKWAHIWGQLRYAADRLRPGRQGVRAIM